MNIEFKCPQCGKSVEADASSRGQVVECPHCAKGIVVPRSGAPQQRSQSIKEEQKTDRPEVGPHVDPRVSDEVADMLKSLCDGLADDESLKSRPNDVVALEGAANNNAVVKFVNMILYKCVVDCASDIRIEPFEKDFKIRFRVGGSFNEVKAPDVAMAPAIISRVKIMANLNIAERHVQQDGRIAITVAGRPVDLRVSCLPTVYGESVVIRILDQNATSLDLKNAGQAEAVYENSEAECPRCHAVYEVTRQEIGTTAVCVKCKKKFIVAIKQPSPEEALAKQIKDWELENRRAEEKWKADMVRWEKHMAELKSKYQEELTAYDRCKLNYVEDLQEGGLLCKCEDDFEFSLKRGEIVYRRVFNVSLEESRGVRRTESHRSSQRSVDWSDDYNGRKRRLGDSYGYSGKSESKTDYQFQPIDTGNVYVTNQRFLFIGQQQQRILSFDKILSFDYDWIQEGGSIKVRAENRQRAMRFTGGNFYEFALVMKVIREPDFRDFLLKGPCEDVKNWLDSHRAFPNWMATRVPQQPKYPAKPQKPIPRPKPTLAPPLQRDPIDWFKTLESIFSGIMRKLEMWGVCVHAFFSGLNGNCEYELPPVETQRAIGCFTAVFVIAAVVLLLKWIL